MAAEKKSAGKTSKEGPSTAKKSGGKKSGASESARGGLAKPVKPDKTLAAIVGSEPLTRAALTQKVWDYVKKHDLQDPKDRRSIRADAKLKPIFGGKDKVTMFEMTRLVNQHITAA